MAKQGMKRPEIRQKPKNDQQPVPEIQGKAKHKQKAAPVITDDTRVVFSEEINRDSDLDDG
jgi:hypothetical protein